MEEYNYNSGGNNYYAEKENEKTVISNPIVKIFGLMLIGLCVSVGVAYIIYVLLLNASLSADAYVGWLMGACIATLITGLVSQFSLRKGSTKVQLVCFGIYSVSIGIMLSMFMVMFDFRVLGLSVLCSALSFGVMALYAFLTKKDCLSFGMVGCGLLMGSLILIPINMLFASDGLFWAITYIQLAAILLISVYDIARIKQIANSGMMTNALAVYMALQIYSDLVILIMRFAYIIGLASRKK